MLKKLFALSDQGERELKHGIVATTIDICASWLPFPS